MQEGMLFHTLLDGESDHYFQQMTCRIKGDLDIGLVEESLNELIRRHAVLRTVFLHEGWERPIQVVLKERKGGFEYVDVEEECRGGRGEEVVEKYRLRDRSRKFDLGGEALMRLTVLRSGEREW